MLGNRARLIHLLVLSFLFLSVACSEAVPIPTPTSAPIASPQPPTPTPTVTPEPSLTSTSIALAIAADSIEPAVTFTPEGVESGALEVETTPEVVSEELISEVGSGQLEVESEETTPIPNPQSPIAVAQQHLTNGRFLLAAEQFGNLAANADEPAQMRYLQGQALYFEGDLAGAKGAFEQAQAESRSAYYLGEIYTVEENWEQAAVYFTQYLEAHPVMVAYIMPALGDMAIQAGDFARAIQYYETAVTVYAPRFLFVDNALALADLYENQAQFTNAVAQYDAVQQVAQTPYTRSEMMISAGDALLEAGDQAGAFERYRLAMETFPKEDAAYQSLVLLLDNEVAVDQRQRGIVNYFAGTYAPALEALTAYIDAADTLINADAYWYRARTHAVLGDNEAALADLDAYAIFEPADSLLEIGRLAYNNGDTDEALSNYRALLVDYAAARQAPVAAWRIAAIQEELGDTDTAIASYIALADIFPEHEDADEALFHAGELALWSDDQAQAMTLWQRVSTRYPTTDFGQAGMLWYVKNLDATTAKEYVDAVLPNGSKTYYGQRTADIVSGRAPFSPSQNAVIAQPSAQEQQAATEWLKTYLELESLTTELPDNIRNDARFLRGNELWEIGRYLDAKAEFNWIRTEVFRDVALTYQLAVYFNQLGFYSGAIQAANSLMAVTDTSYATAPSYIAKLAYPVHFDDLVVAEATSYGYDPLLQFALIRQESLFEPFVSSFADARGLSQVIPDTGDYIATKLAWPNYALKDLYKPYVGVAFGSYYIDEVLGFLDNNVAAMLAGYNGGPGNAQKWLAAAGNDHDAFVEAITFSESRSYVQRIYVGYKAYQFLYDK